MKSKFCIIIPIYKEELDCTEKLSLKRLVKVIGQNNYPIFLVKPTSLNCDNYYKIINKDKVREISFDDKYFVDTKAYSQLCINYDFYNKFSVYEYMYIYQLDCYIFEDHLKDWCDFGYDYIGAPILATNAGWNTVNSRTNKWEPVVGNGGFSLRKISTFLDLTNPEGEFRKYYNITDELTSKVVYEDKYFCNDLYRFYDLELPNWLYASRFSWDMNVDLYKKYFNIEYLPMAVHAWPKNIRYWQDKIEEIKNDKGNIIVNFCEEKYKDFFKEYYNENNDTIKV